MTEQQQEHSWKRDRKLLSEDKDQTLALLVGVYRKSDSRNVAQETLSELENLATTYGLTAHDSLLIPVQSFCAATLLGEGKIEELVALIEEKQIDLVLFDDEISPAQQRNLEKLFKRPTIDRAELILEIFGQRAQTKEAQLQVELAKLRYHYPRLKRMWGHLSRQRGTRGSMTGEGRTQREIDKDQLQKEEIVLRRRLEEVRAGRETQRAARLAASIPTFAIVGYTNAGKSSLLKKLTEADVLVENKLFATLDTTSRKFKLPNKQEIILTDTVGFIRKLPHKLIEAFRSTLEEVVFNDILVHLIDISHPAAERQAEASQELLTELGADKKPMITLFNKIDALHDSALLDRLHKRYPDAIELSVLNGTGLDLFLDRMMEELVDLRKPLLLRIPYSQGALISDLSERGRVLSRDYDEEGSVLMSVEVPHAMHHRVQPFIQPSE